MMNGPLISVIVPNYNHSNYLQQRFETIFNQTCQNFEVIILDDCSTDTSRDILEPYKDNPHVSHIVFNEKNSGSPFAQWNKGIELAKGEWIWIAESDDWAEPDFLSVMLENARQHPNCGLVFSKARYMHDGKEMWHMEGTGNVTEYSGESFVREKLVKSNVIYNVSMVLFKRNLFLKIDQTLYDDMKLCGDWFFYAQLCKYTDVLEIDKVCSNYRVHNSNSSLLAEHNGGTFIEGVRVLKYITKNFKVKSNDYARFWGKQWHKYNVKFNYSKYVNKQIKQIFKPMSRINLWHTLYAAKHLLCRK